MPDLDEHFTFGLQTNVFDDDRQTMLIAGATAAFIRKWMDTNQPPELAGKWDLVDGGRPGYIVVRNLVPLAEGVATQICSLILKATTMIGMNFPAIKAIGAIMNGRAVKLFSFMPGKADLVMSYTALGPETLPRAIRLSAVEGCEDAEAPDNLFHAVPLKKQH